MILQEIGVRILEILLVPYFNKEILWTIAPLIFALIMLQMYFGKYKTELLGWNTAFSNSISLMWVTAILLKYMSGMYGFNGAVTDKAQLSYFIMIGLLALITILLAVLNFQHKMPKKLAFVLSSSLPVNILAYFVIVIVMGMISIDWVTFFAALILFLFLSIVFYYYRKSITPPKSEIPILKKHEHIKRIKKNRIRRKFKNVVEKVVPIKKK
jgi:Ca2+/Na+ antiporter